MRFRTAAISVIFVAVIGFAALLPWLPGLLSGNGYYGLHVDRHAHDFPFSAEQENATERLSDLQGRFVYLLFGYLRCADVCHRQVANMLALNAELVDKPVSFVFVSLDPNRDQSNQLHAFFDSRGPHFYSVRPSDDLAARALANEFSEYVVKTGEGSNYLVDHSGFMYLIDPSGRLRLIYTSSKLNVESMLNDLNQLLRS